MAKHYNAFISYKHAPLDSKIASHLQRNLERFRIPGKVRKQTGFKRIERVFRDKEELPLTNNLTETITEALQNSDNLIVICSHQTKKSAWVQKEIETFIGMHGRRNIQTILVEGEPSEVVPEILLKEPITKTDEDGNEVTTLVDVEALSCDFRMPLKQADKIELPRLVSAIIGCPYDDLINRLRHYRMQRLTMILSIVIAVSFIFGAYLLYSLNRFRNDYIESLKSESVALAKQSEELLAEHRRLEAIEVALQALPSEEFDRPVVPEAVAALSDSVLAYRGNNGRNVHAVWNYEQSNNIYDFWLSPDGEKIVSTDIANNITVFDTNSHEVLMSVPSNGRTINNLFFTSDDTFVVLRSYGSTISYRISTNETMWVNEEAKTDTSIYRGAFVEFYDESHIAIPYKDDIYIVDIYDGSSEILDIDFPNSDYFPIDRVSLSPDKSKIIIDSDYRNTFYIFDLNSNSLCGECETEGGIFDILWTDNDHFVIAVQDVYTMHDYDGYNSLWGDYIYGPNRFIVSYADANSASYVWQRELVYYAENYINKLVDTGDSTVGFVAGNIFEKYDLSTGDVAEHLDFTESIIYVGHDNRELVSQWTDESDGLFFVSKKGTFMFSGINTDTDEGFSLYNRYFQPNLIAFASCGDSLYALSNGSNAIIEYAFDVYDHNWETVATGDCEGIFYENFNYDHYVAYNLGFMNTQCITIIDTETNTVISEIDFDSCKDIKFIGMDEDYLYISFIWTDFSDYRIHFAKIDYSRDRIAKDTELGSSAFAYSGYEYSDGVITFIEKTETSSYVLKSYSIEDEQIETVIIPDLYISYDSTTIPYYIAPIDAYYYINEDGDEAFFVNHLHRVTLDFPESWTGLSDYASSEDGSQIIMTDGFYVLVYDTELNLKGTINTYGINVADVEYNRLDGSIMLVLIDSTIRVYSPEDYSEIQRCDIGISSSLLHSQSKEDPARYTYLESENILIVQIGISISIIDTNSWYEIGHVSHVLAYNESSDSFYTYAMQHNFFKPEIGRFHRYALEDLIAMAHEVLGG